MPTRHRRIALTADPELEAAIAAARRELGDMAEARLVRELAVQGGRQMRPDETARAIAELRREGVDWPDRSLGDALGDEPPPESSDPWDPYRASRALDEIRNDTV